MTALKTKSTQPQWQTIVASDKVGFLAWFLMTVVILYPVLMSGFSDDEGLFALQAERLLRSPFQFPNVDYISPYPGGMVLYNALWLKVLGNQLASLRWGLIFLFSLWVPSVFWLCRKVMPLLWSYAATAFVFVSTILIYPSVGANWYGLFLGWWSWCLLFDVCFTATPIQKHKTLKTLLSGVLLFYCLITKQTMALHTGLALWAMMIFAYASNTTLKQPQQKMPSFWLNKMAVFLGFLVTGYYIFNILGPHLLTPSVFLLQGLPLLSLTCATAFLVLKNRDSYFTNAPLNQTLITLLIGFISVAVSFSLLLILLKGDSSLTQWAALSFYEIPRQLMTLFYQPYPFVIALSSFSAIIIALLLIKEPFKIATDMQYVAHPTTNTLTVMFLLLTFILVLWVGGSDWALAASGTLFDLPVVFIPLLSLLMFRLHFHPPIKALFFFASLLYMGVYPVFATPYFATTFAALGVFIVWLVWQWVEQSKPNKLSFACLLIVFVLMVSPFTVGAFSKFLGTDHVNSSQQVFISGVKMPEQKWEQYAPVVDFLIMHSKRPDDTYILTNSDALIYYLTQHQNPTRYDYHLFSKGSMGMDIVEGLETHQVQYIIVSATQPYVVPVQPLVQQYIQQRYQAIARTSDYIVLKRNH